MFGVHDSIYMSSEIRFDTVPEMLCHIRAVALPGPAILMGHC